MREYLFRGKRKDNGEWVYGGISINQSHQYFIILNDALYSVLDRTSPASSRIFEVIPETVGQYTGLRDSKRTEEYPKGENIFKGDIVKVQDDICVVEMNDGCFDIRDRKTGWRDYLKCWTCNNAVEVIGNIYDNPELLKDERKIIK